MTTKPFKVKKSLVLIPEASPTLDTKGELAFDSVANAVLVSDGATTDTLVQADKSQAITNKTIDADQNSISNIDDADIKAAAGIDASKIANGTVTNDEYQRLAGVTSNIQTQLDGKVTGPVSAVDNTLPRFDGTTGELIQGSNIVVSDLDAVTGITELTVDSININGATISSSANPLILAPAAGLNLAFTPTGGGVVDLTGTLDVTGQADIDNIRVDGNTISSQDANGNIVLDPNGTGVVDVQAPLTVTGRADVDNIRIDDNTISSTNTNGNILLDPNGTGVVSVEGAPMRLPELATPSTPASGYGNIYFKSDGFLYQQNDSGTETRVGASASTGVINYLSGNPDAETSTAGWATFADAASSRPTDGTGGSPTKFTWTRSTSSPLRGVASFLATVSASAQGEGVSYDFSIDSADQARVLQISFDYEIASGTYNAGTASTDSDLIVYMYRTTATGRLIEPTIIKLDGSVAGVKYSYRGQFQADSDATGYRLILYVATAANAAFTMKVDNFLIGPAQQVNGAIISNPEPHTGLTIQGGGTLTNNRVQFWREGKWLLMQGTVVLGTTTGSTFQISLPNNLSVSSDTIGTSTNIVVGQLTRYVAVNPSHKSFVLKAVGNRTYLTVGITSLTDATNPNTDLTGGAFTNNDEISIFAKVPISGWGAVATLGQDADTKVNAARAYKASQTGLTINTWNTITFTAAQVTDTGNLWNASTNEVTIPVSGWYDISLRGQGNVTSLEVVYIGYRVDGGTDFAYGAAYSNPTVVSAAVANGFDQRYFNAGQKIQFRINPSVSTQVNDVLFAIQRSAGPSQIQATEYVGLSVNTTSSAIGSALATTVFTNKVLDTHNAYNTSTGIWTCPATATYCIEGAIFATGTFASDTRVNCMIRINGVDTVAALVRTAFNPTGGAGSGIATTTRRILAGQQVELRGATQATTPAYSSDTTLTYLNITKVGI